MSKKEKRCRVCAIAKPYDFYYKHSQTRDGFLSKCKDCCKAFTREHREKNIRRVREADKRRGCRRSAESSRDYRKNNKSKTSAHNKVSRALRSGVLERPPMCSVCKNEDKIYGHHDDYLKPLSVRWLCQVCHKAWHAKNGPGKNG